MSLEGTLTAVAMKTAESSSNPWPKSLIEPGVPVTLFETRIGEGSGHVAFQYDVTADGKRFVVATTSSMTSTPLTVVVNWNGGLKK